MDHEKKPMDDQQVLARLNRSERTYWFMSMVLMITLSVTVIVQYLAANGFIPANLSVENHYRTTLSVGLPGLVILFCLYTTAKRREIRFLKSTLFSQQFLLRRLAERSRDQESTLEELQKVGSLKDMLISTVSHELQTPLASIFTISQTLLSYEEADKATTQKFYRLISEESRRLSDLVRNLLDLAKIESGTMNWDLQSCDIEEIIDRGLAITEALGETRKIKVRKEIEAGLPELYLDRDRMVQVMTNLVGNAYKFTPDGGSVVVSATLVKSKTRSGERALRVTISDTGVGIPHDQIGRIFERFHRAATPMGVRAKGTGLGLAITKDIVEHMGGTIGVESQPAEGSTFFFMFEVLKNGSQPVTEVPTAPGESTPVSSPAPTPVRETVAP